MIETLQRSLMRRALAHVASGTTDVAESVFLNPASSYTDPKQLAAECELLFRRKPLLMGMSCQLPEPGDCITDDLSGVPVLIVRGQDRKVRAFLNVCTHRGARVVEGAGSRRAMSCPYHGWTFALDGTLAGIPDQRSFPGIDPAKYGLTPLPCAERNGMIWVVPTPSPDGSSELDAAAYLDALDPEFAALKLEGYHHYQTRVIRHKMNWKLVVDTFLEPYHFAVLHRNTIAPLFYSNVCLFDAIGPHLREVLPRRSLETQKDLPEDQWNYIAHNTIVYVLFPNTVFVVQIDRVETWRVFPVDGKVDECVMHLDFFIPNPIDSDSARRHWERNMDLTVRTVCDEDFPTGEGIQRNLSLGLRKHTVFGLNEPALAHFEQTISKHVTAGA